MAKRNGWWLRVVVLIGGLVGLAISVTIVGAALRGRGLGFAANVAQVVSVVLGAPSLAVGLVVWWRRWSVPAAAPGTTEVLRAKDVLAGLVAEQWKAEAAIRALDDPDPIPVRWRTPDQPPMAVTALMDHRANIEPDAATEEGAWWTASSADIATLADRFRRTRRRRLVILGGPGTGKTTLAMQLLRHLLATRAADEPVPVLLPVASWNTEQFPQLHFWLADRLTRDYPALRSPGLGVDVVRALTARGQILPVLDGLDELPLAAQAKVISMLNRSLGDDDQLILTSRTAEFTAAVTATGDVVTSAAVLEPLPLAPTDAADYLTRCLPPSPGSGWQQILKELRSSADHAPCSSAGSGPGTVLASVTATPLGLWLLRSVYSAPGANPTELTDPDRFPDPAALRDHLFNQLIPALIATRPPSDDPAVAFRPRRRHEPAQVRRWLSYLAHHLTHQPATTGGDSDRGTRDFAWWRLAATTHAITRSTQLTLTLFTTLTVGLVAALVAGCAGGFVAGPATGLAAALVNGLSCGPGVGLVAGLGAMSWARHSPGYANLRIRQRSAELVRKLAFGLVLGLVFGLMLGLALVFAFGLAVGLVTLLIYGIAIGLAFGLAGKLVLMLITEYGHAFRLTVGLVGILVGILVGGLVTQLVDDLMPGLVTLLMYGIAIGLAFGLAVGFVAWVETPAQVHHATTPKANWYTDRTLNLARISTNALAAGLAAGLTNGLSGGLSVGPEGKLLSGFAGGLLNRLVFGLAAALIFGLVAGLAVGLGFGTHRAWLAHLVATSRLARARLLPRQLMPFLDDCHRLGLLRAVGPIYQFRHAELQDHLSATYHPHGQPRDQRNADARVRTNGQDVDPDTTNPPLRSAPDTP